MPRIKGSTVIIMKLLTYFSHGKRPVFFVKVSHFFTTECDITRAALQFFIESTGRLPIRCTLSLLTILNGVREAFYYLVITCYFMFHVLCCVVLFCLCYMILTVLSLHCIEMRKGFIQMTLISPVISHTIGVLWILPCYIMRGYEN